MFINCRHCHALVATDPATDLPPEHCPRCRGVLRRPDATPAPIAAPPATLPPEPATAGTAGRGAVAGDPASAADAASGAGAAPAAAQDAGTATAPALAADTHAVAHAAAPAPPAATGPAAISGAGAESDAAPVAGHASAQPDRDGAAPEPAPSEARDAPSSGAAEAQAVEVATTAAAVDAPSEAVAPATIADPGQDQEPSPAVVDAAASSAPPADEARATDAPAGVPPAPAFSPAHPGTVRATRRGRLAAAAAIVALVLLLAVQIVLADRERLAADAAWRPLVATACGVLGCEVPPWREPAAITLVSREVRPHPAQPDALRVRASFRNDARWAQAWPRLVLVLSDVNGRPVAARAFEPDEYLGAAPPALLEPGQAADIEFDIAEPSVATVAYAFDFRP